MVGLQMPWSVYFLSEDDTSVVRYCLWLVRYDNSSLREKEGGPAASNYYSDRERGWQIGICLAVYSFVLAGTDFDDKEEEETSMDWAASSSIGAYPHNSLWIEFIMFRRKRIVVGGIRSFVFSRRGEAT
jgi:hypothetical protein